MISRIAAVDFGMARYGFAISQTITYNITPLKTVKAKRGYIPTHILDNLVYQYNLTDIVVGYPLDIFGALPNFTPLLILFCEFLKTRYPHINLYLFDEKYTSLFAKQLTMKKVTDSTAASILLQSWLHCIQN
jgi:putative Holliday junction resolvase